MQFVTLIKFTPQGVSKIKQSPARARKFQTQAAAAGVKVLSLLWTQGQYDGIIVFEADDVQSAAACMLNLAAQGNVTTETMVAFDAGGMEQVLGRTRKG